MEGYRNVKDYVANGVEIVLFWNKIVYPSIWESATRNIQDNIVVVGE
jgi:hypothetical protein